MTFDEHLDYLKSLPENWWKSGDNVLLVGRTLHYMGVIGTAEQAFDFIEKPRKWQREIDILIEEYK